MRKTCLFVFGLLFALSSLSSGVAAELGETLETVPTRNLPSAVISAPDDIGIGRTIILDASASHTTGERTQYTWQIDETKRVIGRNVEAIFTPEKSGVFTFRLTVQSTNLDGQIVQAVATHSVVVFKRKIVLIADSSVPSTLLESLGTTGMEQGVYVKVIRPGESTAAYAIEEAIVGLLSEQKQVLLNASSVMIWTKGIAGVQALMRSVHVDPDLKAMVQNQTIVLVTEHSLSTLARSTRGAYSLLQPREIIITRPEAVKPMIEALDTDAFKTTLLEQGIEILTVNEDTLKIRPWDVLSILVNYLLSHGIAGQTVILLLMLPVIATMFSFLRQIIGITTFGLYTPSIVALSFLALGWWIGLLFLLFILFTGYMTRSFMNRWRLLYIPKVAIILIVVSFSLLALVALGTWFGLTFSRETVFILLILSTQAENFLNLKSEEGWMPALLGVTETVSGALLCVLIVQWQFLQSLVLAYPELILLMIFINIFLGRYTGLRFVEYFRFREVFKHLAEEE